VNSEKWQCKNNVNSPCSRLIVQQSYDLGVEAVMEPFGPRLGALAQLAVRQQREQSMTWVIGILDHFWGLPLTLPVI
jgi:hypothetical protein